MSVASDYSTISVALTTRATAIASNINPYLRLGLKGNPFVAEDVAGVSAPLWIDRGFSAPPLPSQRQLVQVMGVKGAGKTSHLKHWQAQTEGPYCYYPPGWGRVKVPTVDAIAYWDEADRIPLPFQILAFAQAAAVKATVVVGTHADLGTVAKMCGLQVKTIHLESFDAAAVMDWANCRIEAARVPGLDCALALDRQHAAELASTARGSWREVGDRLHIWAAGRANAAR